MKKSAARAIVIGCLMLAGCGIISASGPRTTGAVPGQVITVTGNQNIYSIAQDHGVSMRDIIVLNGLRSPYSVHPGQSLVLPFKPGDVKPESMEPPPGSMTPYDAASPIQSAPLGAIESQPLPPPQIQSQELPPPQPVLTAPRHATLTSPQMLPPTQPSASVEALNAPAPPPQKPFATTVAPAPVPVSPPPAPAVSSAAPDMVWPVQGPVLSGFGPKGQGVSNDGVNIGAPKGSPVVAAAAGTVVYAGDDMKGFGNLVLIRHEGGWVTAYAYLDRTLVSKDSIVAQGDEIGTVGKGGAGSTPEVHFEVRQGGKPVDPDNYIK